MKKTLLCLVLTAALLAGPACLPAFAASWPGVDETVIEKFAEQGGRQAQEPLINTDQGDLLLFVFLLAGIVGGFIGGYYFCVLFPPKRRQKDGPAKPLQPSAVTPAVSRMEND